VGGLSAQAELCRKEKVYVPPKYSQIHRCDSSNNDACEFRRECCSRSASHQCEPLCSIEPAEYPWISRVGGSRCGGIDRRSRGWDRLRDCSSRL
jgi:hypothetical protein